MQVKSKTQKLFIVDLPFDLRYNIWTYLDYMIPVQTTLWFFSFGREHNIKEIKKILNQRWNVRKQYLSIPQRILYMRETGQRDFLVKQLIEEKYVELKTCFMWYRYALINNDRQSFKKIFKWIREKMSREADPNTIPCITRMKLRLIEFVIRIDSGKRDSPKCVTSLCECFDRLCFAGAKTVLLLDDKEGVVSFAIKIFACQLALYYKEGKSFIDLPQYYIVCSVICEITKVSIQQITNGVVRTGLSHKPFTEKCKLIAELLSKSYLVPQEFKEMSLEDWSSFYSTNFDWSHAPSSSFKSICGSSGSLDKVTGSQVAH